LYDSTKGASERSRSVQDYHAWNLQAMQRIGVVIDALI
jgi:hypothetical protein